MIFRENAIRRKSGADGFAVGPAAAVVTVIRVQVERAPRPPALLRGGDPLRPHGGKGILLQVEIVQAGGNYVINMAINS